MQLNIILISILPLLSATVARPILGSSLSYSSESSSSQSSSSEVSSSHSSSSDGSTTSHTSSSSSSTSESSSSSYYSYILVFKDGAETPDNVMKHLQSQLKALGVKINYEYETIIKGFSVSLNADLLSKVQSLNDKNYPFIIEQDKSVYASDNGPEQPSDGATISLFL